MRYRICKDLGRQIGHDVLTVSRLGLEFKPPGDGWIQAGEAIFEADIKTCTVLVGAIGDGCYVAPVKERR